MKSFLRRTLLSGFFVVVPVTLIVIVLLRVAAGVRAVLGSIAAALPFAALFPGPWAVAWAMFLLFLLCFVTGLVRNLPMVRNWVSAAHESLTLRIPIYAYLRSFEEGYLGMTGHKHVQAALVVLDDALAPAFVAEELPDGRYVVFVPEVPQARDGSIYILTRERVHLIDASARQVVHCIHHWGVGTGELLKTMRETS